MDNSMKVTTSTDVLLSLHDEIKALEAQRDEALAEVERLKDSEFAKIMAMSEDQLNALNRLEGHDPKDVAALTRKTFELAIALVKSEQDEALLRECLEVIRLTQWRGGVDELFTQLKERLGETP
jgi:hypothetical protein